MSDVADFRAIVGALALVWNDKKAVQQAATYVRSPREREAIHARALNAAVVKTRTRTEREALQGLITLAHVACRTL